MNLREAHRYGMHCSWLCIPLPSVQLCKVHVVPSVSLICAKRSPTADELDFHFPAKRQCSPWHCVSRISNYIGHEHTPDNGYKEGRDPV